MAHRVVVEEECPLHGGFDPHWSSGQNGPYRACQMSQRRVLDPGSYVLIEKADGEWPTVPCVTCGGGGVVGEDRPGFVTEYLGCQDCMGQGKVPYELTRAIFDALAGGEQP